MLLLLSVGFLFLLLGYSFKWLFNATSAAQKSFRLDEDHSNLYNDPRRKVPQVFSSPNCFFDSTRKTLGPKADAALESIFNIIMEWYILSWYRTVSDSSDFPVQVKMYLQYLCSSLIHRVLMLPKKSLITESLIKQIISHFENVSSAVNHEKPVDALTEERVLRGFGPHLHAALTSRSAEVAYLRSMVNKILPYASLPPALLPFNAKQTVQLLSPFLNRKRNPQKQGRRPSQPQFRQSRSVSSGPLPPNRRSLVPLDANRAAYSFFIEILSTCVLLPAMDAVANPDLINKLIILMLDERTDAYPPAVVAEVEQVPVLSAYVKEWREWLSKKPRFPSPLSNLLEEQLEVYPLMQYMKSVKCTAPMTAVLLMNDIDRRLRTDVLLNDTCHEIRAQIRHILSLIRGVDKDALENDGDEKHGVENQCVWPDSENFAFFNLPSGFEDLLLETLRAEDTQSLTRLVHSGIWEEACHAAYDAVADRFLPMYLESPEYQAHILGLTHRLPASLSPRLSNSPRHSSPAGSTFVFNNPLKSMFGGLTVDGTSLLDGARVGSTEDFMHLSGSKSSGEFSKHQLHAQYLLSETQTIDLSDWLVYIPGLSRPEVQPKRRLIDQLAEGVMNIPGSGGNSNQPGLFEHDRSLPPTLSAGGRPLATLSTRESLYKNKIADQLSSLHAAGQVNTTDAALSTSATNRTPQLSTQYMFTVRTERLVNGERQAIARVDRKYSEFYVLEQKLVEFHGNAIKQQLPKRQFAPRSFEFMESRREPFEQYLQYLLSQPFLRNSELLFGFLTSKADFTTSLLSDLNLGRFVKSVPMKLTKEKGQFLQDFLVGFYVSCNPQPIMLEPAEPRPFTPHPEPVITVLPSSGVGVLGGYDCLASPDHYAIDSNGKFRRNWSVCSTTVHKPLVSVSVSDSVSTTTSYNKTSTSAGPTSLDNRLRSRLYWNNAGLPADRLRNSETSSTIISVTRLNGLSEMLFFVLEKLLLPAQTKEPRVTPESKSENSDAQTNVGEEKTMHDGDTKHLNHKDPMELRENTWNEALLNAPTLPDTSDGDVAVRREVSQATTPAEEKPPDVPTKIPTLVAKATDPPGPMISIGLPDLYTSVSFAVSLVKEYVSSRTRRLLLWTMRVLWFYFKLPLDQWLATKLDGYVQASLGDSQLAASLQLLEATLFTTYPPSTEAERLERKSRAYTLIKTAALKLASVGISDSSAMEQKLRRLFLSFQQPKWNKQLTYVLLDQLITELFPELDRPTLTTGDGLSS